MHRGPDPCRRACRFSQPSWFRGLRSSHVPFSFLGPTSLPLPVPGGLLPSQSGTCHHLWPHSLSFGRGELWPLTGNRIISVKGSGSSSSAGSRGARGSPECSWAAEPVWGQRAAASERSSHVTTPKGRTRTPSAPLAPGIAVNIVHCYRKKLILQK